MYYLMILILIVAFIYERITYKAFVHINFHEYTMFQLIAIVLLPQTIFRFINSYSNNLFNILIIALIILFIVYEHYYDRAIFVSKQKALPTIIKKVSPKAREIIENKVKQERNKYLNKM